MIDIGLTNDEFQRAQPLATHISRTFSHYRRERQPVPDYMFTLRDNLRVFLGRFPHLRDDPGPHSYHRLKGGCARYDGNENLPGADHTFFWRTKGMRGPIVVTTFPYHWSDDMHAQAWTFALVHGLQLEVRPPDVPDLWFPGQTIPVVWARANVDWRQPAATDCQSPVSRNRRRL
jgi:hypothetical protein